MRANEPLDVDDDGWADDYAGDGADLARAADIQRAERCPRLCARRLGNPSPSVCPSASHATPR